MRSFVHVFVILGRVDREGHVCTTACHYDVGKKKPLKTRTGRTQGSKGKPYQIGTIGGALKEFRRSPKKWQQKRKKKTLTSTN